MVFADITVIDATGGPVRPHRMVTISGTKVAAIEECRRGREAKAAEVIDGRGKFLIPGLWDMHVHWYDERFLPLFIANGVTGVRQMWGMVEHYQWRRRIQEGSLLGPRQIIASPIIDGPKPYWPDSIAVKDATEGGSRSAIAGTMAPTLSKSIRCFRGMRTSRSPPNRRKKAFLLPGIYVSR